MDPRRANTETFVSAAWLFLGRLGLQRSQRILSLDDERKVREERCSKFHLARKSV
jgi:hypothetical protein